VSEGSCEPKLMSGSNGRRRQKKLEKNRKKRAAVKQNIRKRELEFTGVNLMRKAREAPFGPTFVSKVIDDLEGDADHNLISVIVTRKVAGAFLPHLMLVDRACFGVKDATLFEPMSEGGLVELVESMKEGLGELRRCEPEFAQSVVFHALDYARKFGFAPHEDFRPAMVEPRPETLLDTPGANRERPLFIAGPYDDVGRVCSRLEAAVGPNGYDLVEALEGVSELRELLGSMDADFDVEADDGEEEDVEEGKEVGATIDTTGTPLEDWTERR
jgi:hypothetical protein